MPLPSHVLFLATTFSGLNSSMAMESSRAAKSLLHIPTGEHMLLVDYYVTKISLEQWQLSLFREKLKVWLHKARSAPYIYITLRSDIYATPYPTNTAPIS